MLEHRLRSRAPVHRDHRLPLMTRSLSKASVYSRCASR